MNSKMDYPIGAVFRDEDKYYKVVLGNTGMRHMLLVSRCEGCAFNDRIDKCILFKCTCGMRKDETDIRAIEINRDEAVIGLLTIK